MISTDSIIKEEDQKTYMDIEEFSDENKKKMNPEICMFGTESSNINDQNRFQRRKEDDVSSGNASADRKELMFPSAGLDSHYADRKQLERRHFHSPSEDYMQPESNANQDKQIDSSGISELTKVEIDDADQNQTQRHHFHDRTSSDIFFRHLAAEDNVSSGSASVDREEILFPSAGHDTRYADQKQLERRHFHSPAEDYMQPESNVNQDKQVDSSGTVKLTKVEIDHADQNQTQRHHFHERTESDILFPDLPPEGNVSSGSVDREEILFSSAGHDTHYADQEHGEKRHLNSSGNYMQPEIDTNQDEQVNSSLTVELSEADDSDEEDDDDENKTQRHHFHDKTSSDIFFRHLPTEGNVSSGSANVDREEELFPSAGHYTRYADQKQGERRHFHSPSEDYMQQENIAN